MVSLEAFTAALQQLQTQNAENMSILLRQQSENLSAIFNRQNPMTDSRGIGKPVTFHGEEKKYAEWKAKLVAYLKVAMRESDEFIQWAGRNEDSIDERKIELTYGDRAGDVKDFAVKLYATLISCTEEDAFRICHSVKDGNGLEAIRLLMRRYDPKNPGTERAILKAIINNQPAKKAEDIEGNLRAVAELMKKYEAIARDNLPEDLGVTVIIDLCQ